MDLINTFTVPAREFSNGTVLYIKTETESCLRVKINSSDTYFILGVKFLLALLTSKTDSHGFVFEVMEDYNNADFVVSDGSGHIPSTCMMSKSIVQTIPNKPHVVLGVGKQRWGSTCPYVYYDMVNCENLVSLESRLLDIIKKVMCRKKNIKRLSLPCNICRKKTFSNKQRLLITSIAYGFSLEQTANLVSSDIKNLSYHRYQVMAKMNIKSSAGLLRFCKWFALYKY